jgi:hypothetical protein
MTTIGNTQVHLVSGKHEEVEGSPEEIAAQLGAGGGLVRLGEIFVNPAHVTHLIAAASRGMSTF